MNTLTSVGAAVLALFAVVPRTAVAQVEVLAVERRDDVRGRDATVRMLQAARGDFRFERATPREFCRLLSRRLLDKVTFQVGVKDSDLAGATATLDLRATSAFTAMAVLQEQTGLRFVFRSGVVFCGHADDLKPLTYVVVYDLRSQCARLRHFPGPELRLPGSGNDDQPVFPPDEESETTISGFTAEGIEALLVANVTPEAWGSPQASLTNTNGLFVVRHSVAGHAQVRDLLVALGLIPPPRTIERPTVGDVPAAPRPRR